MTKATQSIVLVNANSNLITFWFIWLWYKEFTCSVVTRWGCRAAECWGTCLPCGLHALVPGLPPAHAVSTSQDDEQKKSSEMMSRDPLTVQLAAFMGFRGTFAHKEMWCSLSVGCSPFCFLAWRVSQGSKFLNLNLVTEQNHTNTRNPYHLPENKEYGGNACLKIIITVSAKNKSSSVPMLET